MSRRINHSISDEEFENVYGETGRKRAEIKREQTEAARKKTNETGTNQTRSDVAEASASVLAQMIGNTINWFRNNQDVKVQEVPQLEEGEVIDGEVLREWRR